MNSIRDSFYDYFSNSSNVAGNTYQWDKTLENKVLNKLENDLEIPHSSRGIYLQFLLEIMM